MGRVVISWTLYTLYTYLNSKASQRHNNCIIKRRKALSLLNSTGEISLQQSVVLTYEKSNKNFRSTFRELHLQGADKIFNKTWKIFSFLPLPVLLGPPANIYLIKYFLRSPFANGTFRIFTNKNFCRDLKLARKMPSKLYNWIEMMKTNVEGEETNIKFRILLNISHRSSRLPGSSVL